MRKKIFLLPLIAMLATSLFINGCSKSSSSNNSGGGGGTTVSDLVASFSNYNSSTNATTTYTFTYDGQNRLLTETISDGTPTASYVYGNGTVTKTQGTTTTIYTLNAQGYAASDNQGNTYTYDGNGFLTSETNPNGASTANTISNNNIVSSVQTTSSGTTTNYGFTYLANANSLKYGLTFLGASDGNLVQTESINGVSYPFSYTYDSYSRVSTEKIVSGSTTLTRTYTYEN